MTQTLDVDPHVHTVASYDSRMHPETLLDVAVDRGLDAVAVTDHDTIEGARVAQTLAASRDIVVIVGCEVSTTDGHLLTLGVEETPPADEPLPATARRVRRRGGLAVVPHPFQRSRHGAQKRRIAGVDGIEVQNALTLLNLRNAQARRFARRRGYAMFGGSDGHRPQHVGLAGTEVTIPAGAAHTADAILEAMRAGRTTAAGRRTSAWQYVSKLVNTARYRTARLRP